MTRVWAVPLGGQLDLLAQWLEPIVDRPGLVPVPPDELRIVVAPARSEEVVEFEPFDALVGPVRVAPEGVVAEVIPVEPFLRLRALLGAEGEFTPQVVFARARDGVDLDPIEAVASDAVLVDRLALVDPDA